MVQSININHSEETILNYNETTRYRFNGSEWRRYDNINIDRYIDKNIGDIDVDVASMDVDDYIELSQTYHNNLLQSEDLKNSIWKKRNLIVETSQDFFVFPNNAFQAFSLKTSNNTQNTDHYISEQFIADCHKTYIFSAFVQDIPSSLNHKMAISVRDAAYNVCITADFDLSNTSSWSNDRKTLTIKFRNSNTYEEISGVEKYFSDVSAKLIRIKKDGEYYFRPFIKFKVLNNTHFTTAIHILNESGEYKYTIDSDSYIFYMSGGQLEVYTINPPAEPAPYMITYKKPVQHIVPFALYGIHINPSTGKQLVLLDNKVNYLYSAKEVTVKVIINPTTGEEIIYQRLQSSVPDIVDPNNGDLAVVQSMISFGSIASDINNKKYTQWVSLKSYQIGDRVTYLSNLYECKQNHVSTSLFSNDISKWKIILDAVGLGFRKNDDVPSECMYYDSQEKVYRIKKCEPDGDKWKMLKYKSSEQKDKALIRALTFNQGVFETWDQQSSLIKPMYELGYNTGGNYNFIKLSQISDAL